MKLITSFKSLIFSCLLYKRFAFICFLLIGFNSSLKAQNIDSLKLLIRTIEAHEDFKSDIPTEKYQAQLITLAKAYKHLDIDSTLYYSKKVLALNDNKNMKVRIDALVNIGYCEGYWGNTKEAIQLHREAYNLTLLLQDQKQKVEALYDIGQELKNNADYGTAFEVFSETIDLALEIDAKYYVSKAKENIAHLYRIQNDFEHSLTIYKEVVEINKGFADSLQHNITSANMAIIYAKVGQFEKAISNIDHSLDYAEKVNNKRFIAYTYGIKGQILQDASRPKEALKWFVDSKLYYNQLEDKRNYGTLLNRIALAHFELQQFAAAKEIALQALDLVKPLQVKAEERISYKILFDISQIENNTTAALNYHIAFKAVSDSVFRKENTIGLELLKAEMNFEKQKEDKLIIAEAKLTKQRTLSFLAVYGLLLLIFVITFLYSQSKKRKKLVIELKDSNAVKDKLFSIIGHDLRGPITSLQQVLMLFKMDDINISEFSKLTPKLKNDVDAVAFTLNNLLEWGKTQFKGQTTVFDRVPMYDVVHQNIELLSHTINYKKLVVKNNISKNCAVLADHNEIDFVVRNLLSNAIKFTCGNGNISIACEDLDTHYSIAFTDTGVGMDEAFAKTIFKDSNEVVSTFGTQNEQGTGLGLKLCREMIKNNNGLLKVKTKLHEGSTFSFELPKA